MQVEFPDSTDKLGLGVKAVSDEITDATPQQRFNVVLEVSKYISVKVTRTSSGIGWANFMGADIFTVTSG